MPCRGPQAGPIARPRTARPARPHGAARWSAVPARHGRAACRVSTARWPTIVFLLCSHRLVLSVTPLILSTAQPRSPHAALLRRRRTERQHVCAPVNSARPKLHVLLSLLLPLRHRDLHVPHRRRGRRRRLRRGRWHRGLDLRPSFFFGSRSEAFFLL